MLEHRNAGIEGHDFRSPHGGGEFRLRDVVSQPLSQLD
jgi:hypothetical protein